MNWGPAAANAAAAIHAAFREELPVRYTGAGVTNRSVAAVKVDIAADSFQGPGKTLRQISFEVQQCALPEPPGKGNRIVELDGDGTVWRVIDITRRDDVGAWVLIVEQWT